MSLVIALGFEMSWEPCDGKWPVHGFGFRRQVWQLFTAEPGSQISLRVCVMTIEEKHGHS